MKHDIKLLLAIIVLFAFLSISFVSPKKQIKTPQAKALEVKSKEAEISQVKVKKAKPSGIEAPDFKLQDIHGDRITLSSYKDKQSVILFFWTTWCPYCREALRLLNDMYAELVKDGLEVLAINIGEPSYKVDNFVKSYQLNYRVLLDKYTTVAYAYDLLGVPTYVFIDKNGYIYFKGNSFPKERYKDLISE